MTNYICINGKKAELTKEQMKALGIELPKKPSPFDRVREDQSFYYIGSDGNVGVTRECYNGFDTSCYRYGNYCTDRPLLEQRALYENLNRLLWRYSMEHDGDKINWDNHNKAKFYVFYDFTIKEWKVSSLYHNFSLDTFFYMKETAKAAIEEIIKPFMEAHPDFKF